MNELSVLGNANLDWQIIMLQKVTVIFADIFLYLAILRLAAMLKSKTAENFVILSTFLLPGILILDHIEFGYNGFLYGILILSFSELFRV